uniref:Uncharacterized protein n=1 Tax=Ditylenchus dipsaci TaxID=166011 RepID=A0A915EJZ1_9BILA
MKEDNNKKTSKRAHNESAFQPNKKVKQRLDLGMKLAAAAPTMKTKSAVRAIKRGTARDVLISLPKDSSIQRRVQRMKYQVNMSTVNTRR